MPLPFLRAILITPTLLAAVVAVAGVGTAVASVQPANYGDSARIINGSEITDNHANPGAVQIYSKVGLYCAGTRIAPRWVLTARHCKKNPAGPSIEPDRIFTESVQKGTGAFSRIKNYLFAPQGDMVLFELESDVPGQIASWSAEPLKQGDIVAMLGWGRTGPGKPGALTLMSGQGEFSHFEKAPNFGGDDAIVTCKPGCGYSGDSGGPLLRESKVVGTLSGGNVDQAAEGSWLNRHSPIAPNAEWIMTTTGVASDGPTYWHNGAETPSTPEVPQRRH